MYICFFLGYFGGAYVYLFFFLGCFGGSHVYLFFQGNLWGPTHLPSTASGPSLRLFIAAFSTWFWFTDFAMLRQFWVVSVFCGCVLAAVPLTCGAFSYLWWYNDYWCAIFFGRYGMRFLLRIGLRFQLKIGIWQCARAVVLSLAVLCLCVPEQKLSHYTAVHITHHISLMLACRPCCAQSYALHIHDQDGFARRSEEQQLRDYWCDLLCVYVFCQGSLWGPTNLPSTASGPSLRPFIAAFSIWFWFTGFAMLRQYWVVSLFYRCERAAVPLTCGDYSYLWWYNNYWCAIFFGRYGMRFLPRFGLRFQTGIWQCGRAVVLSLAVLCMSVPEQKSHSTAVHITHHISLMMVCKAMLRAGICTAHPW